MAQGNGSSDPGEPLSPARMLQESWARAFSPTYQSTGLSQDLGRFGQDTVKSAAHLRRLLIVAAYIAVGLASVLVGAAVVATASELLRFSGVIPSHGNQMTVPHLLPPGFLATVSGGGLLWRSARKRHRRPPGTEGVQSQQPPALRPVEAHCPGCRGHHDDQPDREPPASVPPQRRGSSARRRRPRNRP
jgi:hypothetical protein